MRGAAGMGAWRGLIAALGLALLAGLGGCRETPEDAVIAQYKRLDRAWGNDDVQEVKAVLTPESMALFEEIRERALNASAAETKKLTPFVMGDVLALRNGLTGAQIRAMPIDDVIYWLCAKDLYTPELVEGIKIIRVQIAGSEAKMQMGVSYREETTPSLRLSRRGLRMGSRSRTVVEEVPGWVHTFKKINGFWYLHLPGELEWAREDFEEAAAEEDMPLFEYMLHNEKERTGSLKKNLWDPPRD